MNEANNCTLDAFDQLEVRTKGVYYIGLNPTNEFWWYTDVRIKEMMWTYYSHIQRQRGLSQRLLTRFESRKNRTQWWKVYGLGQLKVK